MGIILIGMFFLYVIICLIIYFIVKSQTNNIKIKLFTLFLFLFLPTYDILISNSIKYFYANFTTNEIIYKQIQKPEVLLFDDFYDKLNYSNSKEILDLAKRNLNKFNVNSVQIKLIDNNIREFSFNLNKEIIENKNIKKFNAKFIIKKIEFPIFIRNYLEGTEYILLDENENKIFYTRKYVNKYYNIDFFKVFKYEDILFSGYINLIKESFK